MTPTVLERLANVDLIKQRLVSDLGKNIYSATVYGSTLCEDFYEHSDYDLLLTLKEADYKSLMKIKKIKNDFVKLNIPIDFNTHQTNETPTFRGRLYWHNNRAIYFQKEIKLYGKTIIGEPHTTSYQYTKEEQIEEVVKVVNSILYQARKLLVNRDLVFKEKILMMKFCIYTSLYALSLKDIYPETKRRALLQFHKYYKTKSNPKLFLQTKTEPNKKISLEQILAAYEFISEVDQIIFSLYGP